MLRVWLKYTSALYDFLKEISSQTKWQKAKQNNKKKQTNSQKDYTSMSTMPQRSSKE